MHRLFIAIDFPDPAAEALCNLCFGISGARWVSKDQLHLTLRFIGDSDDSELLEISDILEDINCSQFALTLKSAGYFPPHRKPDVLWVGIDKSDELDLLKAEIESRLRELGFDKEERKFHPHVTLARLKPEAPIDMITGFLSANSLFKVETVPITEFHLYSSVLTTNGAVHTKEASFSLI